MDYIIEQKLQNFSGRVYFTKDTEQAIIDYNTTEDAGAKSLIYQESIHFPFFKLTQNIIHTFKFYHTDVEKLEDLQHEVMVFLLSKIHLFDPSKGAKAYSYFGTIVKRYLIAYNNANYKKKQQMMSLSNIEFSSDFEINQDNDGTNFINNSNNISYFDFDEDEIFENVDNEMLYEDDQLEGDELGFTDFKEKDKLSVFIDQYCAYITQRIFVLFPKKNDAQIADAVLELFRKRHNIDVFNKKALYIYIREMVEVKTPKITKIVGTLHSIFEEKYLFFLENGFFPKS